MSKNWRQGKREILLNAESAQLQEKPSAQQDPPKYLCLFLGWVVLCPVLHTCGW